MVISCFAIAICFVFICMYRKVCKRKCNTTYFLFPDTMEAGDFKDFAKAMTDYIAEYLENIRDR